MRASQSTHSRIAQRIASQKRMLSSVIGTFRITLTIKRRASSPPIRPPAIPPSKVLKPARSPFPKLEPPTNELPTPGIKPPANPATYICGHASKKACRRYSFGQSGSYNPEVTSCHSNVYFRC